VRDAEGFQFSGGLSGNCGPYALDLDYSSAVSIDAVVSGTNMDSTATLGTAATTTALSKVVSGLTTTMTSAHVGRIIKVVHGYSATQDQYARIYSRDSASQVTLDAAIAQTIVGTATVELMAAGVYLGQGLTDFDFSKVRAQGQWTGREKLIDNVAFGVSHLYSLDGGVQGSLGDGTISYGRLRNQAADPLLDAMFTLHANWGTSPVIEQLSGGEGAGRIGIRAKATPGANPTVVFTFPGGAWDEVPEFMVERINSTDAEYWRVTDTTTTAVTFTYVGTPVAETIFYAQWHMLGR
jgi:hypothetical protein